jgi:hypothetical protein
MRRVAAVSLALLVPLTVFAFDVTDATERYSDGPFSRPEAAAISVLTNAGAVQGNPDGGFRPRSALNRAEFLKIAMLTAETSLDESGNLRCFPDVSDADWFAPFVCTSKKEGIVMGYTDGLFHPERSVTYAEAVKILTKLFDYDVPAAVSGEDWYSQYVRAAQPKKVLLPTSSDYNSPITRGEMARLAAAFLAESEGKLAEYRLAEQGKKPVSSSASSVASSSSSVASSSSVSSSVSSISSSSSLSSSSLSSSPTSFFPARSHFLLVGQRSLPIVSSSFTAVDESILVRGAKVKLKTKIEGIQSMVLVDGTGKDIVALSLDLFDSTDKTWKGTTSTGTFLILKGQETTLGVVVVMKPNASGGQTDRLVQADTFSISIAGQETGTTKDIPANAQVFPQHQTTFGHVTSVKNALSDEGVLSLGQNQLIAAFSFMGTPVTPGVLRITTLELKLNKSSSVAVSNWQIGTPNSITRAYCSVNETVITCGNLPQEIALLEGGRELRLYGDVALDQGAKNPYLQVNLDQAGSVSVGGAVRWTDGTGNFNWVDLPSPLAMGTMWR